MSYNMNMDSSQGYGQQPQQGYGYTSSYSAPQQGAGNFYTPAPVPQQPSYGAPAASTPGFFGQDMLGSLGGAGVVGSAALHLGNERLTSMRNQVEGLVNVGQLKYYFKVDTRYVKSKLARIFFPFLTKDWERDGKDGKALPPKDDVNTPDMYIPIMSFVTYVLIVGLILGVADKFSPEQLGASLSSGFGWLLAELGIYQIGLYLLSIPWPSFYELACIVGYKYPGMVLSVLFFLLTRSTLLYHVVVIYLGLGLFYFTYKTAMGTSGSTDGLAQKRRQMFFLVIAGLQVAFTYILTLSLIVMVPE